jgi:small subunit ribosomal protein S20
MSFWTNIFSRKPLDFIGVQGIFHYLSAMANTKTAIKNMRKTERRTQQNRAAKSRLRTLARNLERLEGEGSAEDKKAAAIRYISALDKAAKTDIIHGNVAQRQKARYSKYIFAS